MSTKHSTGWPQAHRVDDGIDDHRYEITGLWTRSLPSFVADCNTDAAPHIEHRDGRTFIVFE